MKVMQITATELFEDNPEPLITTCFIAVETDMQGVELIPGYQPNRIGIIHNNFIRMVVRDDATFKIQMKEYP